MDLVRVVEDSDLPYRHGFLHFPGSDGDLVLALMERNAEDEDLVPFLALDYLSVMVEGDFLEGGIDLDFRRLFVAIDIARPAEMEELLLAPVGFVEIEGILLDFSVEGDQSLVVLSRISALISSVRTEIKHVPDMRRPKIWVSFEAFQKMFMVNALIFFGIVKSFRLWRVEIRHTFGSIFGVAEDSLRIEEVEKGDPEIVQEEEGDIPAEIKIPGDDIREMGRLVKRRAHGIAGEGRLPIGIERMNHVVETMVEAQHGLAILVDHGDLVGNAPDDDGRMVVLLENKLPHLLDGVLIAVFEMLGDVGNLRPHNHAFLVAEIVEEIVMLIMGEADGVGTDFLDHRHILNVILPGDGVSFSEPILMSGDAAKRIGTAVEEKALLAVKGEGPEAETAGNLVQDGAVLIDDPRDGGIEIGVFPSIPKVNAVDHPLFVVPKRENAVSLSIPNVDFDLLRACREGADSDLSLALLEKGIDLDRLASEVVEVEMVLRNLNQIDIAVDAAIEGEVRLLRVDPVVFPVVDKDFEEVFLLKGRSEIEPEGRIAAIMASDLLFVEKDTTGGIDAFEFNIKMVSLFHLGA